MSSTSTSTRHITVAVAGNPNCGKTTVFNGLTGGRQQIGNWPGVTVEKKEGRFSGRPVVRILAEPFDGLEEEPRSTVHAGDVWDRSTARDHVEFRVVDLPGIYTLSATSEDEIVARDYLLGGEPDLIVNIVDASNIERNLYLTIQLADLGIPVVLVLTMTDIAAKKSIRIDTERLCNELGVPVIAINALNRKETERLRGSLIEIAHHGLDQVGTPVRPTFPPEVERAIETVAGAMDGRADDAPSAVDVRDAAGPGADLRSRWRAIRLIEGDTGLAGREMIDSIVSPAVRSAEQALGEDLDVVLADSRYQTIQRITGACVSHGSVRESVTERIDRLVIHRYLGFPIFLSAMFVVFWFTISVGGAFIDFFDILAGGVFVDGLGSLLARVGAPRWVIAVVADGMGGGIQTVATFTPVIFSMFFALAVLEDSGYMARAAFVMDRFMRWIGLPGKSFVPMLLGFGCTIPAVMATKTLESRRDRLMTIFMTPLMSCGARLPVYALIATAVFGGRAGLVVFSIYVAGIVLAVATGVLMKRTLFTGASSHFVLELPPYHAPRMGQILGASWRRLLAFLHRAGTTIVIMVGVLGFVNSVTIDDNGIGFGGDTERSILAYVGRAVTPAFGPMGISEENWPATVSIFAGLFAKEAAVGTLNSIYLQQLGDTAADQPTAARGPAGGTPEAGDPNSGARPGTPEPGSVGRERSAVGALLAEAVATIPPGLAAAVGADGSGAVDAEEGRTFGMMRDRFSGASAYAYLLFILIYFPCVSALGVVVREIGAFYGWLLALYLTISAWAISTVVYQVFGPFQIVWIAAGIALLAAEVVALRIIGRSRNGA